MPLHPKFKLPQTTDYRQDTQDIQNYDQTLPNPEDTPDLDPATGAQEINKNMLQSYMDRWQKAQDLKAPSRANLENTVNQNAMLDGITQGANTIANIQGGKVRPFDLSAQTKASNALAQQDYEQQYKQYQRQQDLGEQAGKMIPGLANEVAQYPFKQQQLEQQTQMGGINIDKAQQDMAAAKLMREKMNDPNSDVSIQHRELAKRYGVKVNDKTTAADIAPLTPLWEKTYGIQMNAQIRKDALTQQQLNRQQGEDWRKDDKKTAVNNQRLDAYTKERIKLQDTNEKENKEIDIALSTLNEAKEGNDIAANMAPLGIIKTYTNRLNQQELKAAVGDQSLLARSQRFLNTNFGSGSKLTQRDLDDMKKLTLALKSAYDKKHNDSLIRHKDSIKRIDEGVANAVYSDLDQSNVNATPPSSPGKRDRITSESEL